MGWRMRWRLFYRYGHLCNAPEGATCKWWCPSHLWHALWVRARKHPPCLGCGQTTCPRDSAFRATACWLFGLVHDNEAPLGPVVSVGGSVVPLGFVNDPHGNLTANLIHSE